MMSRLWLLFRSIFLRTGLEREMEEEMALHLQRTVERLQASGLSADDARAAAHREFGNLDVIKEEARDEWGGRTLESVVADFRYGARCLSRTPFSALTMIVVFALGIGCNAALFLFISSLVNSPVPGMSHDGSLVRIRGIERRPGSNIGREFSYPEYRDYASQTTLFASVAAWTSADVVLGTTAVGATQETLISGAATYVTANYFDVLGIRPIRGSGLPSTGLDEGEPPLVGVISYPVWERAFGLAPDVVGQALKINDMAITIVGVAPRHFAGARTGGSQMRVWLPLSARTVLQRNTTDFASYDPAFLGLAARLRPGVDPEQTLATVDAIAARSMQLVTGTQSGGIRSTDVVPMLAGNYFPPSGETPGFMARASSLMLPLLILLVTCTNVSALLAGLAIARRREIAIRLALGAARRRIVRQLVTESVLLALSAGAFALFVIWILLSFVESSVADVHVVIDWRTGLFTLVVAGIAGILFGLSPALHGTRVSLADVLKDSGGAVIATRSRLQSSLVVAQIALTQPLLLGMGALILELREDLLKVPSPTYADRVLDVRFNTNPRYGSMNDAREATLRELRARYEALPGVVAVVPQENTNEYVTAVVHRDDRTGGSGDGRLAFRTQAAPAGYFSLMGIPIVRGRDFEEMTREDPTAVVIGAAAASRIWPGSDPIGRRLTSVSPTAHGSLFTVVGVVDESRGGLRDLGDEMRLFVPDIRVTGHFLIRTQAPAQPLLPTIRAVAVEAAPELPLVSVRTLDAIESSQRLSLARAMAAIAGAGGLALFLSAIGLYAVVAFAVRQRVREIGIRTALGADRQQVVRWFVLRGLRLSLIGMAAGLAFSVAGVRLIAALRGDGPSSFTIGLAAIVACIAIAVALLATWIPARRAASVDPLLALRVE